MKQPSAYVKSLLGGCFLVSALTLTPPAIAQSVIFPQVEQAGAASATESTDKQSMSLSNALLKATFINEDGHLKFGGCPELGLKAGTEIFTITLGDGVTSVNASDMTVEKWETETLA